MTEGPFPVDGASLRVSAPNYEAACLLAQHLDGCQTMLVQDGAGSWTVTAQPSQADGRSLRATLSAIERWLTDVQLTQTHVRVGKHEFTLCAGEPA